jgi:LEA14-like dessication related protein
MKKRIFIIVIGLITIFYIIIGLFLFLNLQILEAPEVTINAELTKINSEEAVLKTIIDVYNPNDFEIVMKDLKINSFTAEGYEVANVFIKGGEIGSNKNKSYFREILISFNGHSPEFLKSKISGEVGANFLFIQKTIPIKIGIITNLKYLINELSAPILNININDYKINENGINLNAKINVYNPNSFDLYLKNISGSIKSEKSVVLGNITIIGNKVPAKSDLSFNCTGNLLFKSLDAKKLTININGDAGVKIAGFKKNLSFNLKSSIAVPDLNELILSEDIATFLSIKLDEKFTLKGIVFYIKLELNNSYNIDIEIKEIIFRIHTVSDGKYKIIGENREVEKIIAESGKQGSASFEIIVPYSKIIPIDWSIDWIMTSVIGRAGIKGVNQSVYLEIRGYQSLHPLR